jgi:hypothetical protein
MKKHNRRVYVTLGRKLSNLAMETRWNVNERGVFQQELIEDAKVFNLFAKIKRAFITFRSINNSNGAVLRIFTLLALEDSEVEGASYIEVNAHMRNTFLSTLIRRQEYILQFQNLKTGYMYELPFQLGDAHMRLIAHLYIDTSQIVSVGQNLDKVKSELDKTFPLIDERQAIREILKQNKHSNLSDNKNKNQPDKNRDM